MSTSHPVNARNFPAVLARVQREILADVLAGTVPATVKTFAELHDYVDANEYGGFCDDDVDLDAAMSDDGTAFANRVQDAADAWIRSGAICDGTSEIAVRPGATLFGRTYYEAARLTVSTLLAVALIKSGDATPVEVTR